MKFLLGFRKSRSGRIDSRGEKNRTASFPVKAALMAVISEEEGSERQDGLFAPHQPTDSDFTTRAERRQTALGGGGGAQCSGRNFWQAVGWRNTSNVQKF